MSKLRTHKSSKWSEIRCDFLNTEDNFWRVDAWQTDDGAEEGTVIAYIDDFTGRVIYTDPLATVDEYAQEVIKEKIQNLGPLAKLERRDNIDLTAHFSFGENRGFYAAFTPAEYDVDDGEPQLWIGMDMGLGHKDNPEPVYVKMKEEGLRISVCDHLLLEKEDTFFTISSEEIKEYELARKADSYNEGGRKR